jgi:hypothetical protein
VDGDEPPPEDVEAAFLLGLPPSEDAPDPPAADVEELPGDEPEDPPLEDSEDDDEDGASEELDPDFRESVR